MQTAIRLDHQLLALETDDDVQAMLELVAPAAPGQTRPPLHLALVIDRSGSMAGKKLATTLDCARFLVRRLAPTDELAVVEYDSDVSLVTPLSPVDPERVLQALSTIHAGSMTNLSGGWLKGMEELRRSANDDGPRKVLLLTDGLANVGVTDSPTLVRIAESSSKQGIGTTTIGFGGGFHEELLTGISEAGGGSAYYAETSEEAPGIFAQELEGLTSLVAQNVSVEIRPVSTSP